MLHIDLCVANPIYRRTLLMGWGVNDPSNISAVIQDKDTISTATPSFVDCYSNGATSELPDETGSGKS